DALDAARQRARDDARNLAVRERPHELSRNVTTGLVEAPEPVDPGRREPVSCARVSQQQHLAPPVELSLLVRGFSAFRPSWSRRKCIDLGLTSLRAACAFDRRRSWR